jgi:hypothetical protein
MEFLNPVQGLDFKFWLGHWVTRVNSDLKKKLKRYRFSKKQKSTCYNQVFDRVKQIISNFNFFYFFKSGPILDKPGLKTMIDVAC